MSSRRISSYNDLKPIQAVTVDAFSKFNSENINRLSRIVSKSGNNDVVVNGLDVYGVDDPISIKSSNLLNGCTWTTDGCTYSNNQFEFEKKTDSKYYEWAETLIDSSTIPSDGRYSGYFELQFGLYNGTPTYLVFNLNKHVIDLKRFDMFKDPKTGLCKLIFKYDFNFDEVFLFRIGIYLDSNDSKTFTSGSNIILKNVSLQQIFDNSKLDYYLSKEAAFKLDAYGTSNVHPIHELAVTKGVAIKDDVTVDFLKSNFNDDKKVVKLEVNNVNSWILGNPYTVNDFTSLHASFTPQRAVFGNDTDPTEKLWVDYKRERLVWQIEHGNEITMTDDFKTSSNDYSVSITSKTSSNGIIKITYNQNQIRETTKWLVAIDNGNIVFSVCNPYKLDTNTIEFNSDSNINVNNLVLKGLGNTVKVNGTYYSKKLVKWAYVVVYSSYFKNPVANTNYIGLIRSEDLDKPEYREDYLVLAKVRFIDPYTVDIITYSNCRQDLGVITAEDVNYLVTCRNGEIWNDDTPNTVSDALDILRLKQIDELLKEKYKHDYDAEISDAFNLLKKNNFDSIIKTKYNIDDYSHIVKNTTDTNNQIRVTKIEKDNSGNLYFDTINVGSVFTLNAEKTHYIFTDFNGDKWAVQSDFSAFGRYNELNQGDKIYRKYPGFNTVGPFKYVDKDTTLPVIEFDWIYDSSKELKIPSSVNTSESGSQLQSDKTDIKDDYFLSYHPDESSSANSDNNQKNHKQFITFRNNLLTTSRLKDELDFLPLEPSTLLNRRVLYGVLDSDNKVRIYSSRHQLDNSMLDYHIATAVNNDSSLATNPNNDGVVDKSTKFIFDGDRPTNTFRTKTFLTSKTETNAKVIIDTDYYYKNLIDGRIAISTDPDDNGIYHVQSSSYDMNDLLHQYWFKPDAAVIDNKLHLRIDTEKNFVVRSSDIYDFLYHYCLNNNIRLSTFINKNINLNDRKMVDVIVDIDCTISRLRDLDRRIDGEYETIDKYFKSKLLLINDSDENEIDDEFFNSYVNTSFTLFYYPDNSGKFIPFRTAYNKTGNYVTKLGFNPQTLTGRQQISDSQFIWRDELRGYNNTKIGSTSKLDFYPATSKSRTNQTVADEILSSDNNAFNKARGVINHTYAGCRTEFNFEYVKRFEPEDPHCNLKEYGIENSTDQNTDDDIESETSSEKFIHTLDKLYATAEYYTIPNTKVSTFNGDNSNWIFTTDNGIFSILNKDEIVGDSLDELEEKEIVSRINDKYSQQEIDDLNQFNEYSEGIPHIRFHRLENVNNKNNGCLNLHLVTDDNAENFRWIFSWEGTTGIWRSEDFKCKNRLSLLSTSNQKNSTTFDIKQMVTWKDGSPNESCVIVLSSQNKNNMSSVEVIPYESILAVNDDGTNKYHYLTNNTEDKLSDEGSCYTSFVGSMKKTKDASGQEFSDHMLVNNICIANIDDNDIIMYIGKQRKDKYRFPPEDANGKCSDTPHHGSLIRNSINPDVTHVKGKGKNAQTITDVIGKSITTEGMDISTNYISKVLNIGGSKGKYNTGLGSLVDLVFDGQAPATSTINTIYTLHLGENNNRFLSIGCANNYNTGIDWEMSSYYARGDSINSNSAASVKYGDNVINQLNIKYGIPKSIYEYDGKIYIATTNGILKLDNYLNESRKWISFTDELKHTKWKVPYNYGNSSSNRNGNSGLMLSWMTHTPVNNYVRSDELNVTDWVKIKDGVYAVCGMNFMGIYDRDRFTKVIGNNKEFMKYDFCRNINNSYTFNNNAVIEYDGENIIVCNLSEINNGGSTVSKRLVYNLNKDKQYISNNTLRQVISVGNGKYAGISDTTLKIYNGSWNSGFTSFTFTDANLGSLSGVNRLAFFNNKIYAFGDNFIYRCNPDNLNDRDQISNSRWPYVSKIIYDFDSMFAIRAISTTNNKKHYYLTKITNTSISNVVDIGEVTKTIVKGASQPIDNSDLNRLGSFWGQMYCGRGSPNIQYYNYPYMSRMAISKFKNRSIVFTINGGSKPYYYDQFTNKTNNNIEIVGSKIDRIYPTTQPMRNILTSGGRWVGNELYLDQYVAIAIPPLPYYSFIYDRNIDSMLFAVNGNVSYYTFASWCC